MSETISIAFHSFRWADGGVAPAVWYIGVRPLATARTEYGSNGYYTVYQLNAANVLASNALPGDCSVVISNYQHGAVAIPFLTQYEGFDGLLNYSSDFQESALYNAIGPDGGKVYLALARSISSEGDLVNPYFYTSNAPIAYPSQSRVSNLAGILFCNKSPQTINGQNRVVFTTGDIYDDEEVTFGTAPPYNTTWNPPYATRGGFSEQTLVSQPVASITEFKFDWGDGSEPTSVPAAAALTSNSTPTLVYIGTTTSSVAGQRMAQSVTRRYDEMHNIRLRVKDAWNRWSVWTPIKLFPQADPSLSLDPIWDGTASYGRGANLTAHNWVFRNDPVTNAPILHPGAVIDHDVDEECEYKNLDQISFRLYVTDENGLSDYADYSYLQRRRTSAEYEESGALITAATVGEAGLIPNTTQYANLATRRVEICRFTAGSASRLPLATIENRINATLVLAGARWWVMAENRSWFSSSSHDLVYSDDFFRSFSTPAAVWSGYQDAHFCALKNGGFVSVARFGSGVYFKRSADGVFWPSFVAQIGTLGTYKKHLQIRQLLKNGLPVLEVTNGIDRMWTSSDLGRTWTATTPTIWDSTQFRDAQLCELERNNSGSLAMKRNTRPREFWFRRTPDGSTWPNDEPYAPQLIGTFDHINQPLALAQNRNGRDPKLDAIDGLEFLLRSDDLGREWEEA